MTFYLIKLVDVRCGISLLSENLALNMVLESSKPWTIFETLSLFHFFDAKTKEMSQKLIKQQINVGIRENGTCLQS